MFSNIFAIVSKETDFGNLVQPLYVAKSKNWDFGFQTPFSPVMEGIIAFHDDLVIFLAFILGFVLYIMYACMNEFNSSKSKTIKNIALPEFGGFIHHPTLEVVWTLIPAIILVNLALPSFALLYSIDEIVEPSFTFKAIGHQWYWSYEILSGDEFSNVILGDADFEVGETSFDSYMLAEEDLASPTGKNHHKSIRLLSVDNYIPLPTYQNVRVLITSADVLHSWAVPSLGVKLDACPGRLNQTSLFIEREGYFFGQCSELCGVNHGFMPIGILALNVLGEEVPAAIAEAMFIIAAREEA
jgi:cytochrome c oxidase subunit 2